MPRHLEGNSALKKRPVRGSGSGGGGSGSGGFDKDQDSASIQPGPTTSSQALDEENDQNARMYAEARVFLILTAISLVGSFFVAGGPQHLHKMCDLRGWIKRPALRLDETRALLVVGTMGSGTTQMAHKLTQLGLEVGHEDSDSREVLVRDGTVSWAHGMRFLGGHLTNDVVERQRVIDGLCSKPRFQVWSSTMFDASLGVCKRAHNHWWDDCWRSECRRIASAELGCALAPSDGQRRCTSPFAKTLLQVRHPLKTIATLAKVFCRNDTVAAADVSRQLNATHWLLPTPAVVDTGRDVDAKPHGECTRRFGWYVVDYIRAIQPHVDAWYRVEDTSACKVLELAGVLAKTGVGGGGGYVPSESPVPPYVASDVAAACDRGEDDGKRLNSRNTGPNRFVVTLARLSASDAKLGEAVSALGAELGYGAMQ
ncbi:hypothetical protein RI054_01g02570 [Pseudoscourfieldia marina]